MARIIVVEDDMYMREELIDLLAKAGYEVFSIVDFENTLNQIMTLAPDSIL